MKRLTPFIALVLTTILTAGCGGGAGDDSSLMSSGSSTSLNPISNDSAISPSSGDSSLNPSDGNGSLNSGGGQNPSDSGSGEGSGSGSSGEDMGKGSAVASGLLTPAGNINTPSAIGRMFFTSDGQLAIMIEPHLVEGLRFTASPSDTLSSIKGSINSGLTVTYATFQGQDHIKSITGTVDLMKAVNTWTTSFSQSVFVEEGQLTLSFDDGIYEGQITSASMIIDFGFSHSGGLSNADGDRVDGFFDKFLKNREIKDRPSSIENVITLDSQGVSLAGSKFLGCDVSVQFQVINPYNNEYKAEDLVINSCEDADLTGTYNGINYLNGLVGSGDSQYVGLWLYLFNDTTSIFYRSLDSYPLSQ